MSLTIKYRLGNEGMLGIKAPFPVALKEQKKQKKRERKIGKKHCIC